MRDRIFVYVLIFFLAGCGSEHDRFHVNLSDTPEPEVHIKRYGEALFELDTTNLRAELEGLQPEFKVFLYGDLNNPVQLNRIRRFVQDTLLINVYKKCKEKYASLSNLEDGLTVAFHHLQYYFPEAPIPGVYTYVSGFDYEHPVQLYQDNLLIALDMYLGSDYPYYKNLGLPLYVLDRFEPDYIVRDCMDEIAGKLLNPAFDEDDLLSFMIHEGKRLWFIKAMQPDLEENILLNYSADQLAWAQQNEGLVWAFLIENQLLYSSEMTDIQKFVGETPFTSFFGKESPPRLGWFIGYRIVDRYMQKNSAISLEQLIREQEAQKILKASAYKPEL
ncbi:MAG: hypothetical protein KQI35_16830 [Bacteroidetes bacterium]|nr:hypothetical protein [Bacteroidota bacterium]